MKIRPIKKDKKAQSFFDIAVFIVLTTLVVIGFIIFIYVFNIATTNIVSIQNQPGSVVNITQAGQMTFGKMNTGLQTSLQYVGIAIILGMFISILVSNFLVKNHPAFFFMYVGMTLICTILAILISNSYSDIMTNSVLSATAQSQTGLNYIMLHLPYIIVVVGIVGGILLYMGIIRDEGSGGLGGE